MPATQMFAAFPWRVSLRKLIACTIFVFLPALPLHAQVYQDLLDFICDAACTPIDTGRLTQGTDGNLYGTSKSGGTNGLGTIFSLPLSGSSVTQLWNFDGTSGSAPDGALVISSVDGDFYGTTSSGGTFGSGTLFRFNASTITLTVLHNFTTVEGSPLTAPVEAQDKKLYGHTLVGTVYRVTPRAGSLWPPPR